TRSSMSATIDGSPWTAISVSTARLAPSTTIPSGILSIGGVNSFTGQYIEVAVAVPAAVGTYALAPTQVANASVQIPAAATDWSTDFGSANGTVTLAAVSATAASGTFSFTAVPVGSPTTGNKVVTNGVFYVMF